MAGLFNKIEKGEYKTPKHFSEETKQLLSKMLEVDPLKRTTLENLLKEPWVLEGLSDEKLREAQNPEAVKPTQEQLQSAIPTVEETDAVPSAVANTYSTDCLTAFDLANRMMMGVMASALSPGKVDIMCNTRFIANGSPDQVRTRITAECKKLGGNPKAKDEKSDIKGFFNSSAGLVTFIVTTIATISPVLTYVEIRRGRGDTLQFQTFYRKLLGTMVDIVPKQPASPPEDKEEDEPDSKQQKPDATVVATNKQNHAETEPAKQPTTGTHQDTQQTANVKQAETQGLPPPATLTDSTVNASPGKPKKQEIEKT
eukprot:TRINITY_DN66817_c9_g5_i1.p1 TRINITY_DN66817_c9_g5~~TRINITY_DN66817_c9_g5_i1.p1  ORF type:complete len:355 (+),score=23.35 TRINITY_DN66817_c9_g5_i1:127-1065(+)